MLFSKLVFADSKTTAAAMNSWIFSERAGPPLPLRFLLGAETLKLPHPSRFSKGGNHKPVHHAFTNSPDILTRGGDEGGQSQR
ncbi:MAG: hypothetical protein DMG88_00925 [Acidobacteria bacterium]|nr:MAG: hypothetical protein DMG88_00925 [Acidobacteriota bacterium]